MFQTDLQSAHASVSGGDGYGADLRCIEETWIAQRRRGAKKSSVIIFSKNLGVLASLRENPKLWCGWVLVVSYVFIAVAAVIPYGSKAQTVVVASMGLDKILHFVGFGCMAFLALGAGRGLKFWKRAALVLLVVLFGVLIEFIQYYLPYRTFNPIDIFANVCGVVFGVLVWYIFARCKWEYVGRVE